MYIVKYYYKYFLYFLFFIYMLCFIQRKVGIIIRIDIKAKLKEHDMSRYELAKRIGVTYPTIDNI